MKEPSGESVLCAASAPQFLVSWGDAATARFVRRSRVSQESRVARTIAELALRLLGCLAKEVVKKIHRGAVHAPGPVGDSSREGRDRYR